MSCLVRKCICIDGASVSLGAGPHPCCRHRMCHRQCRHVVIAAAAASSSQMLAVSPSSSWAFLVLPSSSVSFACNRSIAEASPPKEPEEDEPPDWSAGAEGSTTEPDADEDSARPSGRTSRHGIPGRALVVQRGRRGEWEVSPEKSFITLERALGARLEEMRAEGMEEPDALDDTAFLPFVAQVSGSRSRQRSVAAAAAAAAAA